MARRSSCAVLLFASLSVALATSARAYPDDAIASDDATSTYEQGARLLRDNKPAEALVALDASLKSMESPNAYLLRGHALRLLGRSPEAMTSYERAVALAAPRVRAGEERYRPTLFEAGRLVALLRTELGELTIEVTHADDAELVVDGAPVEGTRDGATTRARLWHKPGTASIVARTRAGGAERSASAEIDAGSVSAVRLQFPAPVARDTAPISEHSRSPPVVTWIAYGVGAVAFGTFAGFGLMSASAGDDLDACAPRCPPSMQSEADGGKRDAVIADVALATAAAAVIFGTVAWVVGVNRRGAPRTARPWPRRAAPFRGM